MAVRVLLGFKWQAIVKQGLEESLRLLGVSLFIILGIEQCNVTMLGTRLIYLLFELPFDESVLLVSTAKGPFLLWKSLLLVSLWRVPLAFLLHLSALFFVVGQHSSSEVSTN